MNDEDSQWIKETNASRAALTAKLALALDEYVYPYDTDIATFEPMTLMATPRPNNEITRMKMIELATSARLYAEAGGYGFAGTWTVAVSESPEPARRLPL